MQSIHIHPPEIEDHLVLGRWEGDVIKGAGKRSSADTLVERTTSFVALATTRNVVDSFAAVLNGDPAERRKNDDLRPRSRDAEAQNLH